MCVTNRFPVRDKCSSGEIDEGVRADTALGKARELAAATDVFRKLRRSSNPDCFNLHPQLRSRSICALRCGFWGLFLVFLHLAHFAPTFVLLSFSGIGVFVV